MPIHWNVVKAGLDPGRFTVRTGAAILKKRANRGATCAAVKPAAGYSSTQAKISRGAGATGSCAAIG
jgi:hypothetical protein